ncbi:flagellar protein FlaG [Hathewaya histolytica]|nr:flagellar protein FlaG [Hathewaya histolytica]
MMGISKINSNLSLDSGFICTEKRESVDISLNGKISRYSDEDIKNAGDIISKILEKDDCRLEYRNHEKFKYITMIKLVDSKTGDVIKEIPPEKILDMVASMCEMVGLMIDEKA